MRTKSICTLLFLLVFAIQISSAQRKRSKTFTYGDEVPRTHVAHFEKDIDLKQNGRDSLRQKYGNHIAFLKHTIDTLDVSQKRKTRLLAILEKNPFDEKLLKIIASGE